MRLKAGQAPAFQAPFTVHTPSPGSHVYTFRSCRSDSEDSSEDEFDLTELRVADIKRVNNFIREQDVYALKSIRIPIKIHGVLSERREELKLLQGSASCSGATLIELPETDGAIRPSGCESTDVTAYFKGIDESIQEAAESTESALGLEPQSNVPGSRQDLSSGADWGIRWWNAVSILLLIGIVIPVFYIVYFQTQVAGLSSDASSEALALNTSTRSEQSLTATAERRHGVAPTALGRTQLLSSPWGQHDQENKRENTLT
ncbi:lysM and putative peptidoglycan-binding domain-containing protein 4 isoform X2 [Rhinatrema bivittatum]|uniref:lysM and putative peptidoglycan-binding domain-containing protein 4 isoform X2 n=1 Tax=Rhinatrema bivittatum TaxID=194408 RepID=UPI00112CA3DE|nr:lysM and putative peptidoglycan-binding domain-containing protein 4 isoform X2 [Rhinatrema bivittatum]